MEERECRSSTIKGRRRLPFIGGGVKWPLGKSSQEFPLAGRVRPSPDMSGLAGQNRPDRSDEQRVDLGLAGRIRGVVSGIGRTCPGLAGRVRRTPDTRIRLSTGSSAQTPDRGRTPAGHVRAWPDTSGPSRTRPAEAYNPCQGQLSDANACATTWDRSVCGQGGLWD